MKWTLISFLCIVAINNAAGQKNVFKNQVKGEKLINIALNEVHRTFTPPPGVGRDLKSGQMKKSEIVITYLNFPEEAKYAFQYAASIYEQNISSSVPIMVTANWESMSGGMLAKSGPATFYKNFNSAPVPNVFYPIALVEKLSGKEWNGEKDADILCSFNSNKPWYFGTDGNTPETSYDFVTVALHELAHGLGISGFLKDENGLGKIGTPGGNPSAYDYYIFNLQNQRISDNSLFSSPSAQLHDQLTSDQLDFICTSSSQSKTEIYAPTSWKSGASIYHLKSTSRNELMSPALSKGEAIHNPGESTFQILSEIGWGAATFKIEEIKDVEKAVAELSFQSKTTDNPEFDCSAVQLIFSTDYFSTKDSVTLCYNKTDKVFEGKIPLGFHLGKVQYYFKTKTADNKVITQPRQAPANVLDFKVGPDYYPPVLQHNPVTLVSGKNAEIGLSAHATDNMQVESVTVEYKINGIEQEPIQLTAETNDNYRGNLVLPAVLSQTDVIEYRILAKDISNNSNKKYLPANGFFRVNIFEPQAAVKSYSADFNRKTTDFISTDFEINTPAGFSNGNLHTGHPYKESDVEDERYSLVAQLGVPVVLEENGQMSFDEVVLVEPGEPGANFTEKYFWDFVIVEGSKDNGKSWHPFIDGYDSGVNKEWESKFSSSLKSSTSSATGHENMFRENSINLTDNKFFSAGDTVLFRFRLASDKTITGWGWAIDNLEIQGSNINNSALAANKTDMDNNVAIYPNPFVNRLFFDCSNLANPDRIVVQITDLTGKTIYRETKLDAQYNPKLQIDLEGIKSGIYLASITDADLNRITKKIVKN